MEPTRSSLARPALLLAATVLGLAGCPAPEFAIDRGPAYALSEDADASLAFAGIVGVPNIDDDNRNDEPDWRDADIEEDNDLSPFWVQPELWRLVKRNERLRLRMLDGDADVRVWHDGAIILGDNDGDRSPLEFELTKSDEPIRFDVEFRDYLVQADLELRPAEEQLRGELFGDGGGSASSTLDVEGTHGRVGPLEGRRLREPGEATEIRAVAAGAR